MFDQKNSYYTVSYFASMGNQLLDWLIDYLSYSFWLEAGTAYTEIRYSRLWRIWVFIYILKPDATLQSTQINTTLDNLHPFDKRSLNFPILLSSLKVNM